MVRIALLLLLAFCTWLALKLVVQNRAIGSRQFTVIYLALIVAEVLLWLGLTGRLNPLFSLLGALLPFIARYAPLAMKVGGFRDLFHRFRGGGSVTQPSADISITEAHEILGLAPGASRAEIIEAHKRLIQRTHPDRGGSDWLAARINGAKAVLLAHIND